MVNVKVSNILKIIKSKKKTNFPIPAAIWQNPLYFIAFGLGSGAMPIAPGTFGTLMAIPFYLVLRNLPLAGYFLFLVLFIAFSSWLSERVSREIGIHDHPGMCIDEFAGFFVTMFAAPHGVWWIVLGFCLFRIFDIFKPWPVNYIDRHMNSGFGMILDDVIAGIYACLVIQLIS